MWTRGELWRCSADPHSPAAHSCCNRTDPGSRAGSHRDLSAGTHGDHGPCSHSYRVSYCYSYSYLDTIADGNTHRNPNADPYANAKPDSRT